MKIATWNIYWLGDRFGEFIKRIEADYLLIAQIIQNMSPDVLALEEIVDPEVLEHILKLASGNGKNYIIRNPLDESWMTSDTNPTDGTKNLQKVFLCINTETVEFVHGDKIQGASGRKPFAALLRNKETETEFVTVAVHLRSGYPVFLDPEDAQFRKQEVESLTSWIKGQSEDKNPSYPKPDSDNIIVLGDFNAEFNDPNHSLDDFKGNGFSDWLFTNAQPDGNHPETAIDDHYVIDFIMLSPALKQKIVSSPTIYTWDFDKNLGGAEKFHDGVGGSGKLKNYGVSDHRPVMTVLKL